MFHKYLVLVGDEDSKTWSVAMNTSHGPEAKEEYLELKADGTPAILIYTGDYVTV